MKMLPALAGALALLCAPSSAAAENYIRHGHANGSRGVVAHTQRSVHAALEDPHLGWTKTELAAQQTHSGHVLAFFTKGHRWMIATRHKTCAGVPWSRKCRKARALVRAHRWLSALADKRMQRLTPVLPPHYSAWMCIHGYEGAWNDSGDPYWGGLQFGPGEWRHYGGRFAPTADKATPIQQMWAAEAYWSKSGFYPWPNTARRCGLI